MTLLTGPLIARKTGALVGECAAPGDKSISHRALIFAALADGQSAVTGLLEGDDVLRTAAAMRALGADVERDGGVWRITGGPWRAPAQSLYFGNSGTGARLVMGAVAGARIAATFDGDKSLRSRPMGRVLEPLRMMGVTADDRAARLPVAIAASAGLDAVSCKLAKPSAQVKSAIMLAALGANGVTKVHEPVRSRDHTERMLGAFGADLAIEPDDGVGRFISMQGGQRLRAADVAVPGDPSSAAFVVAAALVTPGSDVVVKNVLVNPLRTGLYETLREMGADIAFENQRESGGEPVADIRARYSVLHGVDVPAERAPSMIDEYPVLAVAAAFASGETKMNGLGELRVKESDRVAATESGLAANGVDVKCGDDWLRVIGNGAPPTGGGRVKVEDDHRIAMSFLALGLASDAPVEIDESAMIATSFPNFAEMMLSLGAALETP